MGYGIDIGSTAVKVVAVRRTLGSIRIVAAARRRVGDAAALPKAVVDAVGPVNGTRAGVVGLSGRDISLHVVQQPNTKPANYRAMMGYELQEKKGDATDLYADYCTLREPDAYFPQYLALVGLGKSAYVDERIGLAARADVDVRDAVPNAFALYAAYKNAYDVEGGTVLLLDLGSDNMDLAFVRGGRLVFARTVSSGARVFDAQIAGAANVDPVEAEALKISRGNLGPSETEEEDEGSVRGPVRSAAGQLAGIITSSINNAKVQLADRELAVDKIYLSGGGARVRGLADYLAGALRIPVEPLDPFRRMDTSAVDALGAEPVRSLPTDLAVAVGLAQLVAPPAAIARSTLSILPDRLKKRRDFFRTTLWLALGGGALVASLLGLTVLAVLRGASERSALERFTLQTADERRRIEAMDVLERDQRELAARIDALTVPQACGRVLLDTVARLKKALPPEIKIREFRLVDPSAVRKDGRDASGDRMKAAFTVRRRGLVTGEIESESDQKIQLRGHPDAYLDEDVAEGLKAGVVRWPATSRVLLLTGEINQSIRGEVLDALNAVRDQLADGSRGVKAAVQGIKPSDKPGWKMFEILVSFE